MPKFGKVGRRRKSFGCREKCPECNMWWDHLWAHWLVQQTRPNLTCLHKEIALKYFWGAGKMELNHWNVAVTLIRSGCNCTDHHTKGGAMEDSGAILSHISSLKEMLDQVYLFSFLVSLLFILACLISFHCWYRNMHINYYHLRGIRSTKKSRLIFR